MERKGREEGVEEEDRSILRPIGNNIGPGSVDELGLIKIRYFGRRINVDYPRSCLHLDGWKYEARSYLFTRLLYEEDVLIFRV